MIFTNFHLNGHCKISNRVKTDSILTLNFLIKIEFVTKNVKLIHFHFIIYFKINYCKIFQ